MKSSTVFNDTAPVWAEFYEFLIEINEVLKFEIFDKDMSKNDLLGEVQIAIKKLKNMAEGTGGFRCKRPRGVSSILVFATGNSNPTMGPWRATLS